MFKMLRIRLCVDCMLGVFSQHRLFVNNLTLRDDESQSLV